MRNFYAAYVGLLFVKKWSPLVNITGISISHCFTYRQAPQEVFWRNGSSEQTSAHISSTLIRLPPPPTRHDFTHSNTRGNPNPPPIPMLHRLHQILLWSLIPLNERSKTRHVFIMVLGRISADTLFRIPTSRTQTRRRTSYRGKKQKHDWKTNPQLLL